MGTKKKTEGGVEPVKLTAEQRQAIKRERFLKLASKRVNNAMRAIRNVGRMGNRANYSYTSEEALKIAEAVSTATSDMRDCFAEANNGKPEGFTL